jgi:hypothetical protein
MSPATIQKTLFVAAFSLFSFAGHTQPAPTEPSLKQTAPAEPPAMAREGKDKTNDVRGAINFSRVFFVSPKDGETVGKTFTAKFGTEGVAVAKAGAIEPGQGHFHLIIDGGPVTKGQVIPMDKKHLPFAEGQLEAKVTLPPGSHSLTLQFGDGAHRSYGDMMSQTIKVNVK